MSSLVLCKGHLVKLVQSKEAMNVLLFPPCPHAGSSSYSKFRKAAQISLLPWVQIPLMHEEPSALGAGAAADARRTGSNYQ